jgi:uncharacterized repeat protein (TIGR02543 family)
MYEWDRTDPPWWSLAGDITSVVIQEGVTSIGSWALSDLGRVSSISVPQSITSIGAAAFAYSEALTSLVIPAGVTSIGDATFYNCISLQSVTIPSSVTTIGATAFHNCQVLNSLTIPAGVTSIGDSAFSHCMGLGSLYLSPSITTIGANAFYNGPSIICQEGSAAHLYALEESIPHTVLCVVTFDANGGSLTSADATRVVQQGSALGPLPNPTRIGHSFQAWYTAKTGGSLVSATETITTGTTYYARWTPNSYTVTFKNWDGTVLASPSVFYGSAPTPPANPTRTGYRFIGWDKPFSNVTANLTITALFTVIPPTPPTPPTPPGPSGAGTPPGPGGPTKPDVGTPDDKPKAPDDKPSVTTHRVTYHANGGKVVGKKAASVTRKHNASIAKLPVPKRAGYKFLGWYTSKVKGKKVSTKTKIRKDVSYYAHWKKQVYVVKYHANGGKVVGKKAASVKRAYKTSIAKLPIPKKAGYKFTGWYTGKVKGKKVSTKTKIAKNVTLYAHWKRM